MLSRHGSRYPTVGANVASLGGRIAKAKSKKDKAHFSHALEFLNDWKYELGYETLVPKGGFPADWPVKVRYVKLTV